MTTEFVDDPIVPLSLTLPGATYMTLYHPGWFGFDDDEESQAFLGDPGDAVYGFRGLRGLTSYVGTADIAGLAPGPDLEAVRKWTAADFEAKLCSYDLVNVHELADGQLAAEEQAALGSSLALLLDLLDFLEIDGEHADTLREDDDISKLASGDDLLSIFAAGKHRKHVVELLTAHWPWCVGEVAKRFATPN